MDILAEFQNEIDLLFYKVKPLKAYDILNINKPFKFRLFDNHYYWSGALKTSSERIYFFATSNIESNSLKGMIGEHENHYSINVGINGHYWSLLGIYEANGWATLCSRPKASTILKSAIKDFDGTVKKFYDLYKKDITSLLLKQIAEPERKKM